MFKSFNYIVTKAYQSKYEVIDDDYTIIITYVTNSSWIENYLIEEWQNRGQDVVANLFLFNMFCIEKRNSSFEQTLKNQKMFLNKKYRKYIHGVADKWERIKVFL